MYGINYLVHLSLDKTELEIGKVIISLEDFEVVFNKGIKIISIVIIMYLSIKIGKYLIKKAVDKQVKSNAALSLDPQRAKTLGGVMKSILKYSVYFLGITSILSVLFGGISFTFASIGGVALGLGSQSLIKDFINGFFILFEDQFGIGDYVTIGNFSGIVQTIGIRTTIIKDFTGDIHSIPNGMISEVTNHSRGNTRFIVDVDIAYEEDIDNAINAIKECCDKFQKEHEDFINEPIEVSGVSALAASSVTIRTVGRTKPLTQWKMENELRKAIKITLDENGIEIPYPKTQLININSDKGEF
ncbi:mechanosensitive ion channel family protein [Clostridium butyricum]|uniref:Mechanosensitive ion channel protein n=1 Tax=Clostridium butyricum TaxID=1492 RepID=A0A2S7F9D9_CLOBU|nr:mechanosensitive ion channel family protein [Clostridium butyricum]APF23978.1 mechanosensitive ion channel family protein [Clostridium butyricum]KHD13908.1 mechanosensitive ion channel protein [Clostridium butyricum]MBS5984676.1 mechanosensitive ion channel family protein [Clostridium butyricum]MBZ0314651.1 mechanosensitive ion channel family protein [Clostridium butyricum]MDB2154018.1 mechanosensitive ion channel family protein [Clostridium butyricum]